MATKIDKLDLLQIAWRRKSLIALCLVIGLVAGGLFYLQSRLSTNPTRRSSWSKSGPKSSRARTRA